MNALRGLHHVRIRAPHRGVGAHKHGAPAQGVGAERRDPLRWAVCSVELVPREARRAGELVQNQSTEYTRHFFSAPGTA